MKKFMILIGLLTFSSLKVSLSGQGLFDFGSEATSQFNRGKLEQDAGKSILILEARDNIGGLASSIEFVPGFKCNVIHDTIKYIDPRLINELKLKDRGLKFIDQDLERVVPLLGNSLDKLSNQSILVTGSAGFLGTWIIQLVNFLNITHIVHLHQHLLHLLQLHLKELLTWF